MTRQSVNRQQAGSGMLRNEHGATVIMVAILMVVLLSFAALAIDIGYLTVAKNELQNAADSAALAGARQLGKIYEGDELLGIEAMTYEEQLSYDCSQQITYADGVAIDDCQLIENMVKEAAQANVAANKNISINPQDIFIGFWGPDQGNSSSMVLTQSNSQPDAVRVIARRDSTANGPVSTVFAKIFSVDSMDVNAVATAALTGQSTAGPGELELPIGIPRSRFVGEPYSWCGTDIKFSPPTDTDTCGGWTDFEDDASAPDIEIRKLLDGRSESPELTIYEDDATFNNGSLSDQTFEALLTRYENEGFDVDEQGNPRLDSSGNPVGPEYDLSSLGIGPAVPLTDATPMYDLPDGVSRSAVDATNEQLRYPPCAGGSGNCSGDLRYKHLWRTGVLVYDSDTCAPNTTYSIIGFTEVQVKDVLLSPDKMVQCELLCNYVSPGANRGGGGVYGTKGSIPGLVQ